jgi:hypothetical protein
MTDMKTTPAQPADLTISDLEVHLFAARPAKTSAASAFIASMSHGRRRRPAPVTACVPQPPQPGRTGGIVESVLLRAS